MTAFSILSELTLVKKKYTSKLLIQYYYKVHILKISLKVHLSGLLFELINIILSLKYS